MNRFYFTVLSLFTFLVATPNTFGQARRFELFAGYSPLRNYVGSGFFEVNDTLHGWNASLLTKVNPWLGVVVDFSGHYDGRVYSVGFSPSGSIFPVRNDFMFHTGLIGPQVTLQHGRFKPFARASIGASRLSFERWNDMRLAWGVGGGLDWQVFENIKIRIIQVDYLKSDLRLFGILESRSGIANETLRTSFGLVIPF